MDKWQLSEQTRKIRNFSSHFMVGINQEMILSVLQNLGIDNNGHIGIWNTVVVGWKQRTLKVGNTEQLGDLF